MAAICNITCSGFLLQCGINQKELTFCCDDTGGVVIKGLSGTVLVWGVLILGDTYDLGDEASDVKDIGDWLDGWAVKKNKRLFLIKPYPILNVT